MKKGKQFFYWLGTVKFKAFGLHAYYRAAVVNPTYHKWKPWAQQAYLDGADAARIQYYINHCY